MALQDPYPYYQLLKVEELLLFSVLYHSELNIIDFKAVNGTKQFLAV